MYTSEKGDLSKPYQANNNFIVVILEHLVELFREPPPQATRNIITTFVYRLKRKQSQIKGDVVSMKLHIPKNNINNYI